VNVAAEGRSAAGEELLAEDDGGLMALDEEGLAQRCLELLGSETGAESQAIGLVLVGGQLETIARLLGVLELGLAALSQDFPVGQQLDLEGAGQFLLLGIGQSDGQNQLVVGREEPGHVRFDGRRLGLALVLEQQGQAAGGQQEAGDHAQAHALRRPARRTISSHENLRIRIGKDGNRVILVVWPSLHQTQQARKGKPQQLRRDRGKKV
jgi:hypothetical protein